MLVELENDVWVDPGKVTGVRPSSRSSGRRTEVWLDGAASPWIIRETVTVVLDLLRRAWPTAVSRVTFSRDQMGDTERNPS